jgi:hypothetical protein
MTENTTDKIFWAGELPPSLQFTHSSDIYNPDLDYREKPEHHQVFDLVYLVERDLGQEKAWQPIVDEALRLLKPRAKIALRMSNTPLLSIFELMHFIDSKGDFTVTDEKSDACGMLEITLQNNTNNTRDTNITGISFAIITNGKRDNNVLACINSIENLLKPKTNFTIEILICSPESTKKFLENNSKIFEHTDEPSQFSNIGWITRKKNSLTRLSTQPYIMVAHDRYTFSKDFLIQLIAYGGDFDTLVCRQIMSDGRRFPDWVCSGSAWSWGHPAMLSYGDWSRYIYINGGLMIARTNVLLEHKWNELLFWNQAEDVELTRRLQHHGLGPRFCRNIVAVSETMREGLLSGFQAIPYHKTKYTTTWPMHANGEYSIPTSSTVSHARFGRRYAHDTYKRGIFIGDGWINNERYASLPPGKWGEITIHPRSKRAYNRDVSLTLRQQPTSDVAVLVNDIEVEAIIKGSRHLIIRLTADMRKQNKSCRIHIKNKSTTSQIDATDVHLHFRAWRHLIAIHTAIGRLVLTIQRKINKQNA